MLNTLSYDEYISWVAYYSVEPFPEERADLRNATLIAAISAMLGGKAKPQHFLVDYWKTAQEQKQTPEEVMRRLKLIMKYAGGKR